VVLDIPELSLPDSIYLCGEDVVWLDPGIDDHLSELTWSDGFPGSARPVDLPGWYAVTADNGACIARDSCLVLPCARIWMANAFTPNGDGVNDFFFPKSSEPLINIRWFVRDRWGNTVFESTNSKPGWDGTSEGKPCLTDIYTWVLFYEREGPVILEKEGRITGMVLLLR
jgi:gliding motility-associated-like protein